MKIKILIADDDSSLRRVIEVKLRQKGYEVTAVGDGEAALSELKQHQYDLLLSDMKMPNMNGIELLEKAKGKAPALQVIMMTAFATVAQAVEAVKLGAFDYLTKPFEDEQLLVAIEKAVRFRRLEDENRALREQVGDKYLKHFVGASRAFREMISLIDKVAPTEATILITGESGSGKELTARAIHLKSTRANGSFVAVNCAAIPRELIESELFGHVKGAFTGAIKDKKGKFQLAEGGTLFLDEVSELGLELQAKLLRAVQGRVVEPVGSESPDEVDVRIIAATNVALKERVSEGKFREDLYYRLNVIPMTVPSLRERRDDIPILVREFLHKLEAPQIEVGPDLLERLTRHNWPGNIRELENLVERMVILRRADQLTVNDLPPDFGQSIPQPASGRDPDVAERGVGFQEAQRRMIVDALEKCFWNKSKAAELLQIPRHILIYRMKQLGIKSPT